jgi:hypothetical protein
MWGAGLETYTHVYTPPREILAATSRLNYEALAMRDVLAHTRAVFYPYMCRLLRCAVTIAAVMIGYDDMEVAARTTMRRRRLWSTISSTLTCDYVGSFLQLFFRYSMHLVVTINDLLLTGILVWHGRSSASVAYPTHIPWVVSEPSCIVLGLDLTL